MRISRYIKKNSNSSIPCCIQFWNTLETQVPNTRSIKTTTVNIIQFQNNIRTVKIKLFVLQGIILYPSYWDTISVFVLQGIILYPSLLGYHICIRPTGYHPVSVLLGYHICIRPTGYHPVSVLQGIILYPSYWVLSCIRPNEIIYLYPSYREISALYPSYWDNISVSVIQGKISVSKVKNLF